MQPQSIQRPRIQPQSIQPWSIHTATRSTATKNAAARNMGIKHIAAKHTYSHKAYRIRFTLSCAAFKSVLQVFCSFERERVPLIFFLHEAKVLHWLIIARVKAIFAVWASETPYPFLVWGEPPLLFNCCTNEGFFLQLSVQNLKWCVKQKRISPQNLLAECSFV